MRQLVSKDIVTGQQAGGDLGGLFGVGWWHTNKDSKDIIKGEQAGGGLEEILGYTNNLKASQPRVIETVDIEPEKVNFDIFANISFRAGQLDYEIPDVMQQNTAAICTVRIAGNDVKLDDIKISSSSTHTGIRITDEMSVKLEDAASGVDFKITAISSERQAIIKGEFTEWKISVIPLKAGIGKLFLQVSAHFNGKIKDMKLIEKSIRINGDPNVPLERVLQSIKKKIVFMAADTTAELQLGKESNKIEAELERSEQRDTFLITKFFAVTKNDFSRVLLKEKPKIVHFSGHGESEGIFLVGDSEEAELASADALKKLFGVIQKVAKTECVVLNACFSQNQASEIVQSVPVVVGTLSKITDSDATNFSIGFYQGLGAGLSYDDAYEVGRVQVLNEDVLVLLKQ